MSSLEKILVVAGIGVFLGACPSPAPRPRMAPPPPPPRSAVSKTTVTPEQMEEVQTLVQTGIPSLNRCYQKELEDAKKPFKAKIVVKFVVGTQEKATSVHFALSTLQSARFKACIKKTIMGWEFPKLRTEADFTYPFAFEPAY